MLVYFFIANKKNGWGRTNSMAKRTNRLGMHQWYGQTNTQGGDALTVLPNKQTGWGRTNNLAKRTNRGGRTGRKD